MIGTMPPGRRARALLPTLALLGALAGTAACQSDDITGPTSAVATFKDDQFDFATLHTFAMPDTVVHLVALTGAPQTADRFFDHVALDRVRENFVARGYTEVVNPRTETPDFVVLVGAAATRNYDAYVTYPWYSYWGFYPGWGWYAPGFDPTWGITYPWYPSVGVTAYDRGTMLVTLIPTRSVNPTAKTIQATWAGAATAVLDGSITATDVTNAIDEMFERSPYLTASVR